MRRHQAPARSEQDRREAGLLLLLLGFVFASGIAALVYQVLWVRLLTLVLGGTVWAVSTVLASFMGGLALGSFVAARTADRVRRPLRWYALVEMGIGASALLTPLAFDAAESVYVPLARAAGGEPGPAMALRVALAAAILILPTSLMGATLPLVVRAALRPGSGIGERVSLLYATNTVGAITGVLLTGLVLIGGIGITATLLAAAALNIVVGLAALLLSTRMRPEGPAPAERHLPSPAAPAPLSDAARRAILAVFALSGFASFALEVVWFRVLVHYVPATTYAFTIMLATVLAGIAAGSYAAALLIRRGAAGLGLLAAIELALAAATLASLMLLARSGEIAGLAGTGLVSTAIVASALFPATFLLGAAFPLGLRLWIGGGTARASGRVGFFYGLNVLGAIAGSLAAGFALLPALGSRPTLVLAAVVSWASGLALLWIARRGRRALASGAALTLAFAVAIAATPDPFDAALAGRFGGERVLWREEGVQSTVSVHQSAHVGRILYLDGLHQANDGEGMVSVHRLIGHLPMALHPAPRRVLVVGLGGGATAGAAARHTGASVEVVELSAGVVGAAAWFGHVNDDVLRRPNVRVRVDDARNHLLLRPGPYDVITADIIQPHHAGAGVVYSAEYFRLVRDALADDGIALQWIGAFPETRHKLIMRTFLSVFPETTLWDGGTLMIGTKRALRIDPAALERRLADASTREGLAAVGIRDLASLTARYWAGPDELRAYVGAGPTLTDDRPMVEYFRSLPTDEPPPDLSALRGRPARDLVR
ncbi:MAG: hypothetical protein FJX56_07595 [Alphaproteobacteria bacterium]|nr:hypothetical protein [Alphaproteobacteria bacterium]